MTPYRCAPYQQTSLRWVLQLRSGWLPGENCNFQILWKYGQDDMLVEIFLILYGFKLKNPKIIGQMAERLRRMTQAQAYLF